MRTLNRNKRDLYYANIESEEPAKNEAGYLSGEMIYKYGDPKKVRYNVSAATGTAIAEAFGAFTDYSRVLVTDESPCPFVIGTRVWFGVAPDSSAHNYVVSKVADSLNGTLIALREVVTG